MKSCAILSMDCLDDFEAYDYLIEQPLLELGWKTDTISWHESNVNWEEYQAVIIRTPWDYQDDAAAFMQVLASIEQSSAHLENSLDIVRWNIDKIYLLDLEKLGVKLVPTVWRDKLQDSKLTSDDLTQYFAHLASDQIVLKPRISANADNTFWISQQSAHLRIDELNTAFSARDFMIQPFMKHIIEEGEFSLFYFNGNYSHAILKTPKADDFRVQEEHGGRLQKIDPEKELMDQAQSCINAISQLHQMPLYARVDFVRHSDSFALMEAELIEPSLYFNMDQSSPERFAKAFVTRMNHLNL